MAWAVSAAYLEDTPDARAVLAADARVRGHVFAVDLRHLRRGPALAAGATGRLLVVRSPVRKGDLGLVSEGFDWSGLDGGLAPRLAAGRPGLVAEASRLAPPDAPLRWMEDLAARVCGRVCWYQAEAEHGDPDAELAWIIDAGGPTELCFGEASLPIDRAPALYARQARRLVRVGMAAAAGPPRDPLTMALLHHGALLDGPWFEPHSPAFDWKAREV